MGAANSLLRRGAGAAAVRAPAPPLAWPEAASAPAPILTGAAHVVFEVSLGIPNAPGLLAQRNFVWNNDGPAVVRRRLPPGLLGLLDREEQEGAVVRRYQLSKRVELRARMEVVEEIGEIVILEADMQDYWRVCSFCNRPFVGRRLRFLPCGHAFHSCCVDLYFIRGNDGWGLLGRPPCPDCGAPV